MIKYSRQRESILAYLRSTGEHPTAETVYLQIKNEQPKISLATVYRNLSLLVELGQAVRIPSANGADRFDATVMPHDHFTCRSCGCVLDMAVRILPDIDALAGESFGGIVSGHSIMFEGLCPACIETV